MDKGEKVVGRRVEILLVNEVGGGQEIVQGERWQKEDLNKRMGNGASNQRYSKWCFTQKRRSHRSERSNQFGCQVPCPSLE